MATCMSAPAHDPALLKARRVCYRFVSMALADPRTGVWAELSDPTTATLVSQAAEIIRGEPAALASSLGIGEQPLTDLDPKVALARLPRTSVELNALYEANFGLLGGSKCPPYETEYIPGKLDFQRSNTLADVAGFYLAFGLQASTTHPDRPDHVVMECEFMAQLIELQRQALQSAAPTAAHQAEVCGQALNRFLQEHAAWWLPAFARLLARQDDGRFYEAVANFLAALIAAERALAGIEVQRRRAEPSPIETLDECSGCELAAN